MVRRWGIAFPAWALFACLPAVAAVSIQPTGKEAEKSRIQPSFMLAPGDTLRIDVYTADKKLEYRTEFLIAPSGYVVLPSVGSVRCSEKSPETLSAELAEKYRDTAKLKNAQVVVNVIQFAPRTIYVFGSVNTPCAIPSPVGRPLTISQAISAAGGFSDDASISSVQVHRIDPVTGRRVVLLVNVKKVVAEMDVAADILSQPGDTIYVPRAESVFVLGAVNRPGEITLPLATRLRLSQAISITGGFRPEAKRSEVQVQRYDAKTRNLRVMTVDLTKVTDGRRVDLDITVRPGDTIFVPEADLVTVLGEVKAPGPVQLTDVGEMMSIQAAIALSGGTTASADLRNVRLVRPIGADRVEVTTVPADDWIGEVPKIPLKAGDIIVVPRRDGVFVLGEIMRPGVYRIAPGQKLTVARVLAAAGGFTSYARKSRVFIFRKEAGGKIKKIEVDLEMITEKGDLHKDVELQPGDQVYFP